MSHEFSYIREATELHFDQAPVARKGLSANSSKWPDGAILSATGLDNKEQIREVLDAMYSTAQQITEERGRRGTFNMAVTEHELEHIDALGAMRQKPEAVGLVVVRRPPVLAHFLGTYSVKAFTQCPQLPPLESAAVAGYPLEPSLVDLAVMRKGGFWSVTALGDAIKVHNRSADSSEAPIPLPKLYKS